MKKKNKRNDHMKMEWKEIECTCGNREFRLASTEHGIDISGETPSDILWKCTKCKCEYCEVDDSFYSLKKAKEEWGVNDAEG